MDEILNIVALVNEDKALMLCYFGFLGAIIGSFINMYVARYPRIMHVHYEEEINDYCDDFGHEFKAIKTSGLPATLWGRSVCPKCHEKIPFWANIPILGYFIVRGKCLACNKSISLRYPAVELLVTTLTILVVHLQGLTPEGFLALLWVWLMVPALLIDFDETIIPDELTYALLWAALVTTLWQRHISIEEALVGAVVGYMSLWSIYWVFKLVTGKEGMGYGDFKLFAAIGATIGALALPFVVLAAIFFSFFVVFMGSWKFKGRKVIPLGPGLIIGGFIVYLSKIGLVIPILTPILIRLG
jgi:leader peptidase (prepilin peptidase)/N-methyltransferase